MHHQSINRQQRLDNIYLASLKTSGFCMIDFLLKQLSLPYDFVWQSFIKVRKVNEHLIFLLMVTTSFCTCSMCKTAFRVPLPLMRAKNRWFLCKLRIPSHSKKKTRKHFVRRQEMQNNSRVGSCLCVSMFMATLLTVTSSVLLIKIKPNLICCLGRCTKLY